MACIVNILDAALLGEDPGGELVFNFWDADGDAIADNGGSVIVIGNDGTVNFDGVIAGDYYFTYGGGDLPDCYQEIQFYIRVVDKPNAGTGATINACVGDSIINIFSLLGGSPDEIGTWSGTGTESSNYDDNGTSNDPTDDTFNPAVAGLYVFTYTVPMITSSDYQVIDCENCAGDTATITINVISCGPGCDAGDSAAVEVCASVGCQFDLFDQLGGSPGSGGTWTFLSGPQVIIPTNGDNGTVNFLNAQVGVYQFRYTVGSCTSIVTVTVVATPNAGCNGTRQLCESSGAVNLFPNLGCSPDTGGTWTISPILPVGTFTSNGTINPAIGDAGVYVATYTVTNPVNGPCGTVCIDTATVTVTIVEACFAGNNTTVIRCQDGSIVLNPATLLGATSTGGTWFVAGQSINCNNVYGPALFSVNGGAVQDYQGDPVPNGATLDDFQNLGCISIQYFCQSSPPGCNDFATLIVQIVDCPPACNAAVTISATLCAMTSNITGTCPNPVYQWQVFTGGNWIPAPGNNSQSTYTGLNGQQYRLRVTGCTNCNPIFSNVLTLSCPPPPTCTISCVLTYNTTLGRLEAVITNTGTASCSVPYQFNKYQTNNANCALCSGVLAAQCSGNVIVPASGSVQVNCTVAQTGVEQCWRFVTLVSCCNQTLCCTKIPAAATLCFQLPSLASGTNITQLIVNTGSGNTNILGAAQFNCTEYESTEPTGQIDGIVNCSLAQLVIDIKQWLVANGHAGDVYIVQVDKSSSIRVINTDITFVSVFSPIHGTILFSTSGCGVCDSTEWHQQGFSTTSFTALLGNGGQLNPSVAGSINLFDMLDLYFGDSPVELPHTGTFTAAICSVSTSGCVSINTNCWSDCSPPPPTPVTVVNNIGFADHGDLNWIIFTPVLSICHWQVRYRVTMPNGCIECILINLIFNDGI